MALLGALNSLTQLVLKATMPGVPDFYQGTETWDFSLVDPDNRRPVDYAARRALLARVAGPLDPRGVAEIVRHRADGRLKLLVTTRAVAVRQSHRTLYARGRYEALEVRGARAAHVFAFARRHGDEAGITIVPRLTTALVGEPSDTPTGDITWGDTEVLLPA